MLVRRDMFIRGNQFSQFSLSDLTFRQAVLLVSLTL